MATRQNLPPQQIISSGDMSQATLTSTVTIIQTISMFSYEVTWSGSTPVGVLAVQVSNDYKEDPGGSVSNAGTWNSLTLEYNGTAVSSIPVSGNTGSQFIDIFQTGAYAVRLLYTKASGTGTLQAYIAGKVA